MIRMKYANIIWQNTELASGVKAVNYGDFLQLFVIDYLLSCAGIEKSEVVYLDIREVKTYRGEKLVLPLNWSVFWKDYMEGDRLCISQDIIPVFLAVTIEDGNFKESFMNEYNMQYLKRFEPIGCRDVHTKKMLQSNGIQAYLNGCLTITLPRNNNVKSEKYVYLVDAPVQLKKFIPEELLKNAKCCTQQEYFDPDVQIDEIRKNAMRQYREYKTKASLVITSRLHVAAPCMAWGIPVIFVKDQVDGRFGWLDEYIPLYSEECYADIDWKPEAVAYEERKKFILEISINRVKAVFENYENAEKMEHIFCRKEYSENITFKETVNNNYQSILNLLKKIYTKDTAFEYTIWGVSKAAENFYQEMKHQYPDARLCTVIDTYNRVNFHDIQTIPPEEYKWRGEMIFVLPVQASNAARKIFREMKIPAEKYICAGAQFITEEDLQI